MKKRDTGYRIRDRGYGIQKIGGERSSRASVSCILNPETERRLRWRCRRGLLELDIVLGRFVEAHYARLDEAERWVFEGLLDLPDSPLWDMVTGREAASSEQQALLEKIRAV